jgi:hypothetical protein
MAACLAASPLPFFPGEANAAPSSVDRALDYLSAFQKDDGSFASSSGQSGGVTTWVVMAIAAAGQNPSSWTSAKGRDPVSYLRDMDLVKEAETGEGANNPANFYARLILAFAAAGRPDLVRQAGQPRVDLVQKLLEYRSPEAGNFSLSKTDFSLANVSTTIWAVMALAAAGDTSGAMETAANWLKQVQGQDGGYGWQTGSMEDVDDTAAVVMALRAAGLPSTDPVIQHCLEFIKSHQTSDGGFRSWMSSTASSESTAWVLGALSAAGEDPTAWRTQAGDTPLSYLESLQQPSGLFAHTMKTGGTPVVSIPLLGTAYAIIALSGQSYPVTPGEQTPRPTYAPDLQIISPSPGATLRDGLLAVEAAYSDAGTGVDTGAVKVSLDGADVSNQATVEAARLTLSLGSLKQGDHALTVTVRDRAGNVASAKVQFYMAAYETTSTTGNTTTTAPSLGRTTGPGAGASGAAAGSGTSESARTRSAASGLAATPGGASASGIATSAGATPGTTTAAWSGSADPRGSDATATGEATGARSDRDGTTKELSGYRVTDSSASGKGVAVVDFHAPFDRAQAGWAAGLTGGLAVLVGGGAALSHRLFRREEQELEAVVGLSAALGAWESSRLEGLQHEGCEK